jgi:AraC-like DNA-binding protein
LAAVACFSSVHFHRLFRAWMGETLQCFVHRLRLEQAAQLLVFGRFRSISNISPECGFSSSSTFARAFEQAFGTTAGEWRTRKMCEANRKGCEADESLFWDSRRRRTEETAIRRTPGQKFLFRFGCNDWPPQQVCLYSSRRPLQGRFHAFPAALRPTLRLGRTAGIDGAGTKIS